MMMDCLAVRTIILRLCMHTCKRKILVMQPLEITYTKPTFYDLNVLKAGLLEFSFEAGSGIKSVRVKKLGLSVLGELSKKIIFDRTQSCAMASVIGRCTMVAGTR